MLFALDDQSHLRLVAEPDGKNFTVVGLIHNAVFIELEVAVSFAAFFL